MTYDAIAVPKLAGASLHLPVKVHIKITLFEANDSHIHW